MKEFIIKCATVTACLVIIIKFINIEMKISHDHQIRFSRDYKDKLEIEHKFDFGGNLYKPITIDLTHKGTR